MSKLSLDNSIPKRCAMLQKIILLSLDQYICCLLPKEFFFKMKDLS